MSTASKKQQIARTRMRMNKRVKRARRVQRETVWKLPAGSGYPDKIETTLIYETFLLLSNSTAKGNYTFRGNSVYDPDYTGTGHQPRTFDTYSEMYGKFRVLSTRIYAEGINITAGIPVVFAINANTDVYSFTSLEDVAELPNTRVSNILPVSSRLPQKLCMNISTQKILGLSPAEKWDEDYSCTPAANPSNIWYYNIFYISTDTGTTCNLELRVRLEYRVVCYDRIQQSINALKLADERQSRKPGLQAYDAPVLEQVVNYVSVLPSKK